MRKHLSDMALMQYQLAFEELKDVNKQCREAIAREKTEEQRKAKLQRQAAQRASQPQTEAQTHALIKALAEFQAEVETLN